MNSLKEKHQSQERLSLAQSNKTIQGYSDNVFWERNSGSAQGKRKKKSEK
jgi:site-specific DNA-methyltransferase (adenine-specific)